MRASAVLGAAGLAAATVLVPVAGAGADPLAVRGGTATLGLDAGLRRDAARQDVRIRATGGARLGATRAVLPVRTGTVDPSSTAARTPLRGTLRFVGRGGGTAAVPWSALRVEGGRRWTLRARVPGASAPVAVATASAAARPTASSTVVAVPALRLRLTGAGVRSLRRAGLRGARTGDPLGTLALRYRVPAPVPGTPAPTTPAPAPPPGAPATGRRAELRLDLATAGALSPTSARIQPWLLGPDAGLRPDGGLTAPVTGGSLDPASRTGTVDVAARVVLYGTIGSAGWLSLKLELGLLPALTGDGGGSAGRMRLFDADVGGATFARVGGEVRATGIVLRFTPFMAQLTNRVAGRAVVQPGTPWATIDVLLPGG